MAIGTVGGITSGPQANALLDGEEGNADKPPLDLAIVGRYFLQNPSCVWTFSNQLGVEIHVANQLKRAFLC